MPSGGRTMIADTGWRRRRTLLMLLTLASLVADTNCGAGKNCSFDAETDGLRCVLASPADLQKRWLRGGAKSVQLTCRKDVSGQPTSGRLRERHFAGEDGHYSQLSDLQVSNCRVDSISSGAFAGLTNLRSISVTDDAPRKGGAAPLTLQNGALSGLGSRLRGLNLTGQALWTLPGGELCVLHGLTALNLSRNNLQDASDLGFSSHQVESCRIPLHTLDLSSNRISKLQGGVFGQLSRLRRLYLSSNGLSVVEEDALKDLKLLEVVDLSENSLVALPPDAFDSCSQLSELRLQNNSLSGLAPGLFDSLGQLVVLNLSRNDIGNDWLSEQTFASLNRLVALDLSHNKLTRLDEKLLQALSSLQLLDLSHNKLSVLSSSPFAAMHNLHILKLSHNQIEDIEESVLAGLSGLGSLELGHNRLKTLRPGVLTKCSGLTDLDLENNKFVQLPSEALKALASLRTLDLGGNMISSLDETSFEALSTVYALKLSDNGIQTLKAAFFSALPNLKVLNLAHNNLSALEQGIFKELGRLRMLRLDSNKLRDINGILAGQTNLRWLNVSSNVLQWFDYAFIPKSLEWLDISHNQVEELGNYYKMVDDGYRISTIVASGNRIRRLEELSLLKSVKALDVSGNRIKAAAPAAFEDKPNLVEVDLSNNVLRRLQLPAFNVQETNGKTKEFHLSGNPLMCNCEMEWLLGSTSSQKDLVRVVDIDQVTCRTADRFNVTAGGRTLTRSVSAMQPEDFLCQYQAHCFALCNCCDFFACDCRMQCPRGCTCYHDATWSTNIIQCSSRGHSSIPPLIPMDATAIYMDGNNLTGVLESQAFIGRKRVQKLYLNSSRIEAISNQTFNGLTELEVLHLDHNLIRALTGLELQNLTSLRKLFLNNNHLSSISATAFAALVSLQELHLQGNLLSSYRVWELPAPLSSSVNLHLSGNPWSCACDFAREFKAFASASNQVVDFAMCQCGEEKINLSANVTCSDGAIMAVMSQPSESSSHGTIILVTVILTLSTLLVLIAVFLMAAFRTPIKVWLHSRYGLRVGGGRQSRNHDKLYDALVSYSQQDEDFVGQILLPRLEQDEPGYRLCLQHRDLPNSDNFPDALPGLSQLCARQVLLISRSYLAQQWPGVRLALGSSKKLRLVLVLLQELSSLELASSPELASLMKAHPTVRWNEAGFWDKLRFHLPDPNFRSTQHRRVTTMRTLAGGERKLLPQQQQHESPRYASSGQKWSYEGVLCSNNSSSNSNAASPRTLTGGSSSNSSSSHSEAKPGVRANPLWNLQQQQQQQHHTYHTIEPIYHTLEPSSSSSAAPSPAPQQQQQQQMNLDQFSTLGPRLDVMLPNGQMVPATLVRMRGGHGQGQGQDRMVPVVEVHSLEREDLGRGQQQKNRRFL